MPSALQARHMILLLGRAAQIDGGTRIIFSQTVRSLADSDLNDF